MPFDIRAFLRGRAEPAPLPPAFDSSAEEALELRVSKYQREDDDYLRAYWKDFTHPRFAQYTMALAGVLENDHLGLTPSLFNFGLTTGLAFRAVQARFDVIEFRLAGALEDRKARDFFQRMLPDANLVVGDPIYLRDTRYWEGRHFDVCSVMSALSNYPRDDAQALLDVFGHMTDTVILGDHVENLEGQSTELMHLTSFSGAQYDVTCHPFRIMLKQAGYTSVTVIPSQFPLKGITTLIIGRRHPLAPDFVKSVEARSQKIIDAHYGTPWWQPK